MEEEIGGLLDQIKNPTQEPEQPPPATETHEHFGDLLNKIANPNWQEEQLARARKEAEPESAAERIARRSIPFASSVAEVAVDNTQKADVKAFHEGTANKQQIERIAKYEKVQQSDQQKGTAGKLVDSLLHIPAMVGEAAAIPGGSGLGWLGKAAVTGLKTPLMPSMYLNEASQRSMQQGGEVYQAKNLAPALAFGTLQNMVLGTAPHLASGIASPFKRFIAKAGLGVAELQGAQAAAGLVDEILPEAYRTNTKYGAIGHWWRGEYGELAQSAINDVVTMSVFTALHGNKFESKKIIEGLKDTMNDLHAQGKTPEEAAAIIQAQVNATKEVIEKGQQGQADHVDASDEMIESISGKKLSPIPDLPPELDDVAALNKDKAYLNRQFEASNKALAEEAKRTAKVSGSEADLEKQPFTPEALASLSRDHEGDYLRRQQRLAEDSKVAEVRGGALQKQIDHATKQIEGGNNSAEWQKRLETLKSIQSGEREVQRPESSKEATPPSTEPPEARKSRLYVAEPPPDAQAAPERLNALARLLDATKGKIEESSDPETRRRWQDRADTIQNKIDEARPKKTGLIDAAKIMEKKRLAQQSEKIAPVPSGDNAFKPVGTARVFEKPKAHEKYKPDMTVWEMENDLRRRAGLGPKVMDKERGGEAYTKDFSTIQDAIDALDEKPPGAQKPGEPSPARTKAEQDKQFQAARLEHLAALTNRHYKILQADKTDNPANSILLADAVGKLAERAEKFGLNPVAYMSKRLPAVMDHVGPEKLKELIANAKELQDAIRSDSQRVGVEPEALRRAVAGELQKSAEVPQVGAPPEGAVGGNQGSAPGAETAPAVRGAQSGDVVGDELHSAVKDVHDEARTLVQAGEDSAKASEAVRQGIQAGYESEGSGNPDERIGPPSPAESADANAGKTANFSERPGESDGLDPRTGRAVDAGPDGLNPADQQAVKADSTKIISDTFHEFVSGESGAVDIDKLKEEFKAGMRNTWDSTKRIYSISFPAMKRASRLVNEAAGNFANHVDFSRRAGSFYGDLVFGRDATVEQVVHAWSAMKELRFRYTIGQHIRRSREASNDAAKARAAGDMEAASAYAKEASWHMNARAAVETLVGKPNSPFQHEYEYQAALKNPYVLQVIKNYKEKYVPFKDKTFRDSQGLDTNDPINSFTQIPGMPMRFVSVGEGEVTPTTLYSNKGRLTNPKLRKDPASYAATLASENYELDGRRVIAKDIADSYPKATQAVLYRVMESEGLAVWREKGDHEPLAGMKMDHFPDVSPPKNTQAAARGETEFHVVSEIAGEFRNLLSVDKSASYVRKLAALNHIPGMAALASSVEMVSHGTNLSISMFHPVADVADALRSPMDFFTNMHAKLKDTPAFREKILELSRIQATKPSATDSGIFTPNWLKELLPGAEKFDPTYHMSKWLHGYDEIVRATLGDAYDHLAKKGKAPDTEAGKRDFINQWTGNYNQKAQSSIVSFLRETELQPFAVAATTMTTRAVRNLAGNHGVQDVSLKTDLQLRASVMARLVLLPVAGMMANYARYGKIEGDENTPYGAMKISQDNTGKTMYMDLLGIVGIRRGLNALGIMPYMEARRHGESTGRAATEGVMGTAHALLHTVFGPGPQFLWTAATGEDALRRQIAEDAPYGGFQPKENVKAALAHSNPAYAALTASDVEPGKEVPYGERIAKLGGNLGPKFATQRQPPDVREFRERYEALKKEEMKSSKLARGVGKEYQQSPVLTMFHQAAVELGKVDTVMHSPLTSPEKRGILRERQALLARKTIDAKLKYDAKRIEKQQASLD